MALSKVTLLKTRVKSIKATLENAPHKEKQSPATIQMASNFNAVLGDVKKEFTELEGSLPSPITFSSPQSSVGYSDATYLDIEIFSEQLISLLDLVDN